MQIGYLNSYNVHISLDGGLDPWLDGLWPKIMERFPLPPGVEIIPADVQYPFFLHLFRLGHSKHYSSYHVVCP